jgi:hypothetical protein
MNEKIEMKKKEKKRKGGGMQTVLVRNGVTLYGIYHRLIWVNGPHPLTVLCYLFAYLGQILLI